MSTKVTFPESLPKNLIAVTFSYRVKVLLAIVSILLFFSLFFALIGLSFLVFYYALIFPLWNISFWSIVIKLGAIAGAGMLIVFLFKFMLNLRNQVPQNRIEVSKKSEPELWQFIEAICNKTGAPKPVRIYLDPDVNAYVRYTNNILSLILPVRKELTIGYPLFSILNISEFQAVMSHEFGHFAQRSMRVGSYIGTANHIIFDMINRRDKWDEGLATWMRQDLRIAFFAWILFGLIWTLRQLMKLFYLMLNLLNGSLSREMEFNADKFAVSTTGSMPIITGLWKLEDAQLTLNRILNFCYQAQLKDIYTNKIYTRFASEWNLQKLKLEAAEASLQQDENGQRIYFTTSEVFKGHMYDSHPPNDERERSAKNPFIAFSIQSEQALSLIENKAKCELELGKLIYKLYWERKLPAEIDEKLFDEFVHEEKSSQEILEKYDHTFATRYLSVPQNHVLKATLRDEINPNGLLELQKEIKVLHEPLKRIEEQFLHVQHLAQGTSRLQNIEIDGRSYNRSSVEQAWEKLIQKKEDYIKRAFHDWDMRLCQAIMQRASAKNELSNALDLLEQHTRLVESFKLFDGVQGQCIQGIQKLQSMGQVDQGDINRFIGVCKKAHEDLMENLMSWKNHSWIPLKNIPDLATFEKIVMPNGKITRITSNLFEDGSFDEFMTHLGQATQQLLLIEQKSVAHLLLIGEAN